MNFYTSVKLGKAHYSPPKFLLVMKLTIIMLITAIMQVSAAGYAQRITLKQKNVPLEKVFREIHKQSGYDFFYNASLLKQANPVDINVSNAPLEDVLEACFAGQPLTYTVELKTVIVQEKEQTTIGGLPELRAAFINIKGKVTDESGEPLPGATIRVKATGQAVVSDANGEFSISNLDNNAVLVISYTGFVQQEVAV